MVGGGNGWRGEGEGEGKGGVLRVLKHLLICLATLTSLTSVDP